MLQMLNITKRFGPMTALDAVSLRIDPGSVHGLLGENGAGKSTLMNILFGLLKPDSGEITIAGRPVSIRSPRAAQALGIGMVHQHFKLVPTLTVAENLAVSVHTGVRLMKRRAQEWLTRLKWTVPLDARIDSLSVGQQQRVEIIKALIISTNTPAGATLILDEPTAVLTPQESAELFQAMSTLRSAGAAIIFISHKLAEVRKICDTVTILRRGQHVYHGPAADLSAEAMAEKMVGAPVEMPHLERGGGGGDHAIPTDRGVLELQNIHAGMLRDVSLSVRHGEIVGIAGVDGNGQSDLVQAIVGGIPIHTGRLTLCGLNATRASIRWRLDHLAYVAEDRQRQAMVLPLSVRDNLLLKEFRREPFSTLGWLRFGPWRAHARELATQYDVRCHSINDSAGQLSGGNQQKMVLARELHDSSKPLVIAANPTRGLDIGATAFVMRQLLAARARGAGVLLVHSDLDELLALSDRVFVLYNGTLRESPEDTKEGIGKLMLGV